jgi:hypothetical protein
LICPAAEAVRPSTASRNEKIARLAAYLATLSDGDLARAVLYLSGQPFAASDPRKLSVGYATMRQALEAVTGWDRETLSVCYREVGDSGETIAHLCRPHTKALPMTLEDAETWFETLQKTRQTASKIDILTHVFTTYRAPAIKFFVKTITGNLRIGLQEKMVEEAIAAATGQPAESVRAANNRGGDLAAVALAARAGRLDSTSKPPCSIRSTSCSPSRSTTAAELADPGRVVRRGQIRRHPRATARRRRQGEALYARFGGHHRFVSGDRPRLHRRPGAADSRRRDPRLPRRPRVALSSVSAADRPQTV